MVLDASADIGTDDNGYSIADIDDEYAGEGLEINFSNGRDAPRSGLDSRGLQRLHLHHLLQSVLQDAQTRLFFKAQAVVQSDIGHYVPRMADLNYPNLLVQAGRDGALCFRGPAQSCTSHIIPPLFLQQVKQRQPN